MSSSACAPAVGTHACLAVDVSVASEISNPEGSGDPLSLHARGRRCLLLGDLERAKFTRGELSSIQKHLVVYIGTGVRGGYFRKV